MCDLCRTFKEHNKENFNIVIMTWGDEPQQIQGYFKEGFST